MASLAHHKFTYALPGSPFGDGRDGTLTISADTTQSVTNKSCSGTSGSNTLTIASSGFTNYDVVLIHQSRGTGAGQWQYAKIVSGGGTTTLTLAKPLVYTFTDSGASQAQVFYVPQYGDITINSTKTWSAPAWDGNVGGLLVYASRGTVTVTGTISSVGKGFLSAGEGYSGESPLGVGTTNSASPNGPGGGGNNNATPSGGAGASYDGTGGTGGINDQSTEPTNPSTGTFDQNLAYLGSAGGGGDNGAGGVGAGLIIFVANILTVTGSFTAGGGSAPGPNDRPGGGGSGGLIWGLVRTATLGTNLMVSPGGSAGARANSWNSHPTAGTAGRIHLEYLSSYTGSTTPTLDIEQNLTLVPSVRRGMFI